MIDGVIALYIFMLAAFTGYEVISRVPVILHTPLMSGSNFVHGLVLVEYPSWWSFSASPSRSRLRRLTRICFNHRRSRAT